MVVKLEVLEWVVTDIMAVFVGAMGCSSFNTIPMPLIFSYSCSSGLTVD